MQTSIFWYSVYGEVDIDAILPKGYQKGQRPRLPGPPVHIQTTIYVNSFGNIEEAKMEYKMFGYYRQYWNDVRLAGRVNDSLVLKGEDIAKIWRPDPFCYNARESTLSASDSDINSMMTIDYKGDIVYSRMTIIVAECDMDLHDFPMDLQKCYLKFSSYSYNNKHINMSWRQGVPVVVSRTNLAQFYFTALETKTYIETYALGNYSIIQVDFEFKRRIGYFLIQVYAPDIFIVMLSWIVFWMDTNDMGNRMALGITTILTIMFLMGSINAAMPRVSYPKALDWYLMISFALIFMALIECTIVFVLLNREAKKMKEAGTKTENENANVSGGKCAHRVLLITDNATFRKRDCPENGSNMEKNDHFCRDKAETKIVLSDPQNKKIRKERNNVGQCVDAMAKIIFPLIFLVFNIAYWVIYLNII
ncbi:hypothetical protein QZH41_016262 [Actinostola sp. cb2023]|nr:hypothetical protein QZH41_016262 [Actinostola sp. cb2023]